MSPMQKATESPTSPIRRMMRAWKLHVKSLDIEIPSMEYLDIETTGGGTMYGPFALDQQRLDQEALRRRTASAPHRPTPAESTAAPRHRRWHLPLLHLTRRPRPATHAC